MSLLLEYGGRGSRDKTSLNIKTLLVIALLVIALLVVAMIILVTFDPSPEWALQLEIVSLPRRLSTGSTHPVSLQRLRRPDAPRWVAASGALPDAPGNDFDSTFINSSG